MNNEIVKCLDTIESMVKLGFRFTLIHNADDKRLQIVSSVNPDKIKHKFPEFNIFLSGRNEKMVERVFFYN